MKTSRGILFAALLLALSGCDDNSIKTGPVVEKKYHGAYYWYSSDCVSYDSKMNCTVYIQTPHYQPEQFELCLSGQDYNKSEKRNCIDVPPDSYQKYEVGQHYPDPR